MQRLQVTDASILKAIEILTINLGTKMDQHGRGAVVSAHESVGRITEEYFEVIEAVRTNDPVETANEVIDLAVACVWHLASNLETEELLKAEQEKLNDEMAALKESI